MSGRAGSLVIVAFLLASITVPRVQVLSARGWVELDEPYPCIHAVAVENVWATKTIVGQGSTTDLIAGVANRGHFEETLKVEIDAYADGNPKLASWYYEVTLGVGSSSTSAFAWNTSYYVQGNYTLTAIVEPVPNETETSDNTCINWVVVTVPGDTNGDLTVDIFDAILLARCLGSRSYSPHWNANADINDDAIVDLFDAIILAGNFGNAT